MSTRLQRKHWDSAYFNLKRSGGLPDLFDNTVKGTLRLNDHEYDSLLELLEDPDTGEMSPGKLDLLYAEKPTYAQKRELVTLIQTVIR
jgi:hypothetical protein